MNLLHRSILIAAAICLSVDAHADIQRPDQLSLTILHTNDVHGHVTPFWYREDGRGDKAESVRGGVARRATLIRKLRAEIKNPVMLIDSGDTFTRGPLTTTYEGIADVEAMNAAGYELCAIGNNEFKTKDGVDQADAAGSQAALRQVIKRARFPWVCANLRDEHGGFVPGVQPYVVREINHIRVGFLGLTTPRSASYPQTKGWTISDPITAAKEWVPIARKECDVLIAVTHDGVDSDQQLAAKVSGIDAIVGGDSHTFLYKPVEVKNPDGVTVPIVQDGEFGVNLGRFDLKFSRDANGAWHLAKFADVLLPITDKLSDDAEVTTAVKPYLDPMLAKLGKLSGPVGDTPAERTRNSTMFVLEALRASSGAAIALNPPGYGMFDVFRESSVTRMDITRVMPFHNNLVTAILTGAKIKELAAKSVVSGDSSSLADDTPYTVALVDFVATSAYGLPRSSLTATGKDIRDIVADYASLTMAGKK
ncbi:MAG TPA: bifunctional UDP-sugar hydrolase/5'-nucleotidase [Capsulimonadaceae bacterium]|jgi:5'-nucleotidase